MMISEKMRDALNEQVGHEFGAYLQYLSIASYFESESLPELAGFFFAQAEDERSHAMKFVKYINDAGADLTIPAIPAPRHQYESAEVAVRLSLDWEKTVTRQINSIMDLAMQEKDYLSRGFLDWFVDEQMEEISTMESLLKTVQRAGDNLLLVEGYLQNRPSPAAEA
jgi:bacterioferritin B